MPEILADEWHPVGEDGKAIKDAFGKVLIEGPNSCKGGNQSLRPLSSIQEDIMVPSHLRQNELQSYRLQISSYS
ncbi:hypothetical protein IFM47457_02123 [Aspergillus lentulus]|nr:hypothetical protein IFM47457_02123 [Aspergillus lentulus]